MKQLTLNEQYRLLTFQKQYPLFRHLPLGLHPEQELMFFEFLKEKANKEYHISIDEAIMLGKIDLEEVIRRVKIQVFA